VLRLEGLKTERGIGLIRPVTPLENVRRKGFVMRMYQSSGIRSTTRSHSLIAGFT
jgi:hypothetical protein